jgi:predicted  nucleic acid-binding Zn-ribbon protein
MPELAQKLKLPVIQKVSLRCFSLFAANPNPEFSCGPGVLCLIGANGIGKSTLLSAINFCLTGIVPDPNRSFESMDEYYRFTRTFSSSYFRGRISGSDEDDAEITMHFRVGVFDYEVKRGLFEPDELRALTITEREGREPATTTENMQRGERHQKYAERIVRDIGLASFVEFVFLQHFVFTFDEQRKTLFWSPRILERSLYLAFGLNPNMAKQADVTRREIQHADSRVRNYQWEATRMRKRIQEIRAQAQASSGAQQKYEKLIGDHEALSKQFDEDNRVLREQENALRDANLRLADLSVQENALRDEYAKFFDRRFNRRPPLSRHPLVAQSLREHSCGLCGSSTDKAIAKIAAGAAGPTCPLCDSPLNQKPLADDDRKRLQEIDKELNRTRQLIRDVHKTLGALGPAESDARKNWEATKEKLDEFDRENKTTLDGLRQTLNRGGSESSLEDYRKHLAALEKEKKTAYDEREELKRQLLTLQRELERQYLEVEESFVPKFNTLAQHFLGMPLSVQIDARPTEDIKLVVAVRGTIRRQQQHLSESQRFFLDIALRMALTQHMSDPASLGGMFIDTPEGSLDIAYEKRAGDMLSKFSSSGHQIIMTANLNSSQLLLALARNCGPSGMVLCRMTDWAELSEVQQEEETLFEDAYHAIEQAMGPTNGHQPQS